MNGLLPARTLLPTYALTWTAFFLYNSTRTLTATYLLHMNYILLVLYVYWFILTSHELYSSCTCTAFDLLHMNCILTAPELLPSIISMKTAFFLYVYCFLLHCTSHGLPASCTCTASYLRTLHELPSSYTCTASYLLLMNFLSSLLPIYFKWVTLFL